MHAGLAGRRMGCPHTVVRAAILQPCRHGVCGGRLPLSDRGVGDVRAAGCAVLRRACRAGAAVGSGRGATVVGCWAAAAAALRGVRRDVRWDGRAAGVSGRHRIGQGRLLSGLVPNSSRSDTAKATARTPQCRSGPHHQKHRCASRVEHSSWQRALSHHLRPRRRRHLVLLPKNSRRRGALEADCCSGLPLRVCRAPSLR